MRIPDISFVVPLFNEEKVLPLLIERMNLAAEDPVLTFEFVLVDDGSTDNTAEILNQIALTDVRYQCIFLARNYGHQIALTAGIQAATGSTGIMIMDGDLQDPPELFSEFYKYYSEGYDVIYAVRKKRKENFIKKISYFFFYRLLQKIAYVSFPLDSGDFSFISRKVTDILNKMPEESRYIRGMRSWIGFRQKGIEYERNDRAMGNSKYTTAKLVNLAYNGIFNFSTFPVKFITKLGFISILLSGIYFMITVIRKYFLNDVPVGFTALLFVIIFFGGVQLVSMGIIGEYVLRIFFQVKQRPLYIIKRRIVEKNIVTDDSNKTS